jgi:NAD+ synthase (glutamine-hydrolysing)
LREQVLATRARENGVMVTYTNTVGGQDELVFDGNSRRCVDQTGERSSHGPRRFKQDLLLADFECRCRRAAPTWLNRGQERCRGKLANAVERVDGKASCRDEVVRRVVVPRWSRSLDRIG